MIDWNNYFDHIFCLTYLNNDNYNTIKEELKRVGIIDSGIFEWYYCTNTKYTQNIVSSIPHTMEMTDKCIEITLAHYNIWHIIKKLNYKRTLVIEDDIRFLNDISKLNDTLKSTQIYDITLFDYIAINNPDDFYEMYILMSCYALTQRGIDVLIENVNNDFITCDHYLISPNIYSISKIYNDNGHNRYGYLIDNYYTKTYGLFSYTLGISKPRLCIQYKNTYYSVHEHNKLNEIDLSNYNT